MSYQSVFQKDLKNVSNLFHVIHNRRSIRSFTQQEVPDDILEQILHAGIRAPFAAQLYSIV
ncbi:MAG: nitroreductase family protein, partial [Candidatus Hermodarchaeota archaeon]